MRARNDVKGLIKALNTSDLHVVIAAEDALEDIGCRTIKPFIEALRDKDASVRSGAAWILGNIGDPRAQEPLIEALRDKDKDVRWLAVAALEYIGNERAIESISMLPIDDDEFLKEMVAEALEKIKSRYKDKCDEI